MRLYNATMRINRLELLKADIGLHMIDGFDDLEKLTGEKLTEEAVKEFERQAGILGNGVKGASERAKSLVGQSFMNATFSERIWSNQEALSNKLSTILTKGLIGGKSYQSLAAEIRKDFSVSAREAMRLVRTEMVRVQTQAQIDSYKANGWEEFEFLAYGTASCEICNALNKKHFKISDFQPAENAPPMHPNCRCRTAPYEDEEEYQKWLDSFGNSGKTIDSIGKNNIIKEGAMESDDEKRLEEVYKKSVAIGAVTPLAGVELYKETSKKIDEKLVGIETANGIKIQGKSYHFIDRVIGSIHQKRNGVQIKDIVEALTNPDEITSITEGANGRSQKYILKGKCSVAINPDTGRLIQVNPLTRRNKS